MRITTFDMQYPIYESLSLAQKNSYNYIKLKLEKFEYIDVEGNYSYLIIYLNKLVLKLIKSKEPCRYYVERIQFIKQYYKHEYIQRYCSIWLGDIYYYFNEFPNAVNSWISGLNPKNINNSISSKIISLKLQLDIPLSAFETLSYKKNITKYGEINFDLIIKYVDIVLQKDYYEKIISSDYLLKSNTKSEISCDLFSGSIYGYDINKKYSLRKDKKRLVDLESLPNFIAYIYELSRRAENAIREDLNLPRIGEGWISETELYYKVKNYFSNYTVIQHYNAKWLDKQHLDVYILELNVGIEYHGIQHFQSVEYFGGEKAFIENQIRDNKKIDKCKMHSTELLIIKDGYDFDSLVARINMIIKKTQKNTNIEF